jgi:hypothetical protein
MNYMRELSRDNFLEDLSNALEFAAITNVDDDLNVKTITAKGKVTYFNGFTDWIAEMKTRQLENKNLGIKKRKAIEISRELEDYLKTWIDYFEHKECNLTYTPTGGCGIFFNKRKVGNLGITKSGNNLEFLIVRSYKRDYLKPRIKNLNIENIRTYNPAVKSNRLPWGKEFFAINDTLTAFIDHHTIIKRLFDEGLETRIQDKMLQVNEGNHHVLKEIFDVSYDFE